MEQDKATKRKKIPSFKINHPLPERAKELRRIIQDLFSSGHIDTNADFAKRMGIGINDLHYMQRGAKEITDSFAREIEQEFRYPSYLSSMPSETWDLINKVMVPRGAEYKRRKNKPRKSDPTNIKVQASKDGQWLLDIMEHLFDQEIVISKADFALQLGIDPLRIYSLITERIPIPYKKRIEAKFGHYIKSNDKTDNDNSF